MTFTVSVVWMCSRVCSSHTNYMCLSHCCSIWIPQEWFNWGRQSVTLQPHLCKSKIMPSHWTHLSLILLVDLIPKISVKSANTSNTTFPDVRKVWKFQLCLLCFDINTTVLTALRECFSLKSMGLDCKKIACFRSSGKDHPQKEIRSWMNQLQFWFQTF